MSRTDFCRRGCMSFVFSRILNFAYVGNDPNAEYHISLRSILAEFDFGFLAKIADVLPAMRRDQPCTSCNKSTYSTKPRFSTGAVRIIADYPKSDRKSLK